MVANVGDTVVPMYISRWWDKCGGRIVARRKSCSSTGLIHSEDPAKPPLSVPVFNVTRSFLSGIPLICSSTRDFLWISIPRMKVNLKRHCNQSWMHVIRLRETHSYPASTVFILILSWPSNWFTNISDTWYRVISLLLKDQKTLRCFERDCTNLVATFEERLVDVGPREILLPSEQQRI